MAAGTSLDAYAAEIAGCTNCRLSEGRTQVVFGVGNPEADLMFVGEAPGFHEDKQGYPFVGQAGKLLDQLLEGIGLTREDVYIANVIKCLRYSAQVQLADGTWERIGRLVNSRYDGSVMSLDAEGRLVPRRVIGWHSSPLGDRRVFRLTYRSAKRAGPSARTCVQLTGDHPVHTERGYVPVEDLLPGDRIATGQGLSSLAFDVVCGTVLGDGHLNSRSAHLSFSHSDRQTEYAIFKAELLQELAAREQVMAVAAVAGGERAYVAVQVRTLAHRALGILRSDFYAPKKRVPDWVADRLNARMLAIWFMDDGYTRIRPGGRQPLAEIATVSFSDDDLQVLLRGLTALGLPAKASRRRIYFDVPTTKLLSELIAPYVPPSMRYKLHPEVEERIPFDPSRLERDEPTVLYDEPLVEEITHEGTDKNFFCIDVEETHNFVTAGGVVHNCRPPGNRDPMPDEIEACESHLFRQVELIKPRLVGTLGNFATKLLSGKPAGITRVHGQEQEVTLGGRRVLLYPLYHPAAALYTPSMMNVLQADFARIPELLGRVVEPPAEPEPLLVAEPTVQLGLF